MLKQLLQKRYYIPIVVILLLATIVLSVILPTRMRISGEGILSFGFEQVKAAELSDWTIKFEPSGTSVEDGTLYIRLDFYPSVTSKIYSECYVNVPEIPKEGYPGKIDALGRAEDKKAYQEWLDSLPHIWQLNPAIEVFVAVPPDITVQQLVDYASLKYNAATIATLEDVLFTPNSIHSVSPYMRDKTSMTAAKFQIPNEQTLVTTVNERLGGLAITGADVSIPQKIIPESIDIGAGAANYDITTGDAYTYVDKTNPANATGTLDTFEFWLNVSSTSGKAGTGYLVSGTTYKCRASYNTGAVASGSKITQTGKSVAVTSGDWMLYYQDGGALEENSTGGSGVWLVSGEYADANDQSTYVLDNATERIAVYATGTESTPSITNTPASIDFGVVNHSTTYWAKGTNPSLITATAYNDVPTGDGSSNNTWGCSQISVATGDGDITGTWTASAGDKWDCTNEANWDGNALSTANYVQSSTTGGTFYAVTFPAFTIPSTANVTSVTLWSNIREVTAGANDYDETLKVGGTVYVTESNRSPGTTNTWYAVVYATNPKTTAAWQYDEVNGTDGVNDLQQFGGTGDDLNPAFRISAMFLEVKYTVTAGTNYTVLDETSPNYTDVLVGETDGGGFYLFSTATPTIPTGVTIANLTVYVAACDWNVQTAAGNDIRPAIRVNGTNYLTTASANEPAITPSTFSYAFTTNPNTTVAWTAEDINGSSASPLQQIGCNSSDLVPDVGVSMIYAVVNYSKPLTDGQSNFSVTNNGTVAVNISFSSTNFTGGGGWILGTPDATHARLTVYVSGNTTGTILTNAQQLLIPALAASSHIHWEISLETPTAFADGTEKEAIITLTAVAS